MCNNNQLMQDIEALQSIVWRCDDDALRTLDYIILKYKGTSIEAAAWARLRQVFWNVKPKLISGLTPSEFQQNVLAYCGVLTQELQQQQQYRYYPSPVAYYHLFSAEQPFQSGTVLHQNNGRALTASDMLSVVSYANKTAQVVSGQTYNAPNDALTALKAIDLALNNQPCDKPTNKALHLANDVIQRVGHQNPTIGLIADLAIDFLVKS